MDGWSVVLAIAVILGLVLTCLNIYANMRNNKQKTLEEGKEKGLTESKLDTLCLNFSEFKTEMKESMRRQADDILDIKDTTRATAAKVVLIENSVDKVWKKYDMLADKVAVIDEKVKLCPGCNGNKNIQNKNKI